MNNFRGDVSDISAKTKSLVSDYTGKDAYYRHVGDLWSMILFTKLNNSYDLSGTL